MTESVPILSWMRTANMAVRTERVKIHSQEAGGGVAVGAAVSSMVECVLMLL